VIGERNRKKFGYDPMLDPEDEWPEIFNEPLPSNYKIPKEESPDYESNLSDEAINHTVWASPHCKNSLPLQVIEVAKVGLVKW